jgi:hypothetical protein
MGTRRLELVGASCSELDYLWRNQQATRQENTEKSFASNDQAISGQYQKKIYSASNCQGFLDTTQRTSTEVPEVR